MAVNEAGETTISGYRGELKQEALTANLARIKATFPQLSPDFFKIFIERLKAKDFSSERLEDAVCHVIDNCKYPTPTIADFIGFDQRVKVYTYEKFCDLISRQEAKWPDYATVKISGTVYYVKKSDKAIFNIPDEF